MTKITKIIGNIKRRFCLIVVGLSLVAALSVVGAGRIGAAAAAPKTLPDSIRMQLSNVYRISVEDLDPNVTGPAVTADKAISTAESNFDFVKGGPPTAYLLNVTDVHSGRLIGVHVPGKISHFTPTAVNRLVWAVAIPHAEIPIFGPHQDNGAPRSYTGVLCVFVDAATGEYFKAVAVKV